MGYNQHNAGFHFVRYDPAEMIDEEKEEVCEPKRQRCSNCNHSWFKLSETGREYKCELCGKTYHVNKNTDLSMFDRTSSVLDIERALEYQRTLWGNGTEAKNCPVCKMPLTKDNYCKKCQTWRKVD